MTVIQDRCGVLEGEGESFEGLRRGDRGDGYYVFDLRAVEIELGFRCRDMRGLTRPVNMVVAMGMYEYGLMGMIE